MEKSVRQFIELLFKMERDLISNNDILTRDVIEITKLYGVFHRLVDVKNVEYRWVEYCSSLSNILLRWANSNSLMDVEQLSELISNKTLLSSIFLVGYDSEQRSLLRSFVPDNKYERNFTKILLLTSINNMTDKMFKAYLKAPDSSAFYLAIGWLSERSQMTRAAGIYHQQLINTFSRFKDLDVDLATLSWISKAYMYTTYSSSHGKDSIKRILHKIIERAITRNFKPAEIAFCRSHIRKKPKLIITHEQFSDSHVMIRIFLAKFKILEQFFDVYNLTWSSQKSENVKKQLRKVIICKQSVADIVSEIKKISPDIIFYPSIGMSSFGIALASLRLAPIQLQAFGHPSSSNSPHIDGSINGSNQFSHTGNEKHTTYEGYKFGINMPFTLTQLDSGICHNPVSKITKVLNVGINAKVMKLNPKFMMFLKSIPWDQKVNLNFFPAEMGTEYLVCKNLIAHYFPGAVVHHMEDYEGFMRQLSYQDMAICTFPFGHTNGILDCMYLGVPIFVVKGKDICSSSEYQFLSLCGLQDFIFKDEDKLRDGIIKFITEEDWRTSLIDKFRANTSNYMRDNNFEIAQNYETKKLAEWINRHVTEFRSDKTL